VQENVQVLVRSDLTINAALKIGEIVQTVNVADSAVEIQFNTTTLSQTVDGKMLTELPCWRGTPSPWRCSIPR
jgi:hypothetical protein